MRKIIDRLLRRNPVVVPGLRPVRSAKHQLVMERVDPSNSRQLEMFNGGTTTVLRLELDGKASKVSLRDAAKPAGDPGEWREEPGSESAATALYDSMRTELCGGGPTATGRLSGLGMAAVGALTVVVLAFAFSGGASQPAQARIPGLPPGATIGPQGVIPPGGAPAQAGVSAAQPKLVPGEAMLTADERKKLAGSKGNVALRSKGKEFFVFSDPNCPHCRNFERTVEELPAEYKPVIVPVAFQPGSREKVLSVLCAADPAAEWKRVIAGEAPANKSCSEGEARLAENESRFREFSLKATPTIVSPVKSLLVSAAASREELAMILKN